MKLLQRESFAATLLSVMLLAFLATASSGQSPAETPQPPAPAEAPPADAPPAPDSVDSPTPPQGAFVVPEGWFPPRKVNAPPPNPGTVFVIPIHDEIMDTALDDVIRMKATRALRDGARIVVFDIDTPGGRLDITDQIISIIAEELRDVHTVAYVNRDAISAGSLIAVSCDSLYMAPGSKIGDARPINFSQGQLQTIDPGDRAKIEAYVRAMVREHAEAAGHSVPLVEAMISLNIEVWLIRHRQTRQLQIVNAADWAHRLPGAPPVRRLPGQNTVEQNSAPATGAAEAEEAQAPGEWEFVRVIDGGDDLLVLTAREAHDLAFAGRPVDSLDELTRQLGGTDFVFIADDWGQYLARFLTNAAVQTLLIFGLIFFIYMELQQPGLGIFGALALGCLLLLLGGRYVMGLADWWEVIVIIIGLVLLAIEIFVIPGFGIAGISGIILILIGLIFTAIPAMPGHWWPSGDAALHYLKQSLLVLGLGFIGGLLLIFLSMRHMHHMPLGSKLILPEAPTFDEPPAPEDSPLRSVQVGDTGTVEGTLRPVGKVRIGDLLCDAVAESAFIAAGARVRVLRRDGNRLVVEKVG